MCRGYINWEEYERNQAIMNENYKKVGGFLLGPVLVFAGLKPCATVRKMVKHCCLPFILILRFQY